MYIATHSSENEILHNFFRFFFYHISISNVCVDRIVQASAQTLFDIRLDQIPLYFFLHFPVNNLIFVRIIFVQWYRH